MRWLTIILITLGILLIGGIIMMNNKPLLLQEKELPSTITKYSSYDINTNSTNGSYVIDGRSVITNDSRVFINITPHTITGGEPLIIKVTSKNFSGEADFVFLTNTERLRPVKIEYYNPKNNTYTNSFTCFGYQKTNIIDGQNYTFHPMNFTYTLNPNWARCYGNVTIGQGVNARNYTITYYEGPFDTGNLSTRTIYWNYNDTSTWQNINALVQKEDINLYGMTTAYYIKNFSVVQDQEYEVKITLNKPTKINDAGGKYFFGIKRSQDTITQAVINSRLYYIDPWYNTSYEKRINFTINRSMILENLTHFPLLVKLNSTRINYSHTNNDGSDLLFVGEDETTILPHEIELWNESGTSIVWVRIPRVNDTRGGNTTFSLYYKNLSMAYSTSNGCNVWTNNYTAVMHLGEDPTGTAPQYNDSTCNGNLGTANLMTSANSVNTPLGKGMRVNVSVRNMGINWSLDQGPTKIIQNLTSFNIETMVNHESNGTTAMQIGPVAAAATTGVTYANLRKQSTATLRVYANNTTVLATTSTGAGTYPVGVWTYGVGQWNGSVNTVIINISQLANTSLVGGTQRWNNQRPSIGYDPVLDLDMLGSIDEFRFSNRSRSLWWIRASKYSNYDELLTYGIEETYTAPPAGGNSCTYSSGSWIINMADHCVTNQTINTTTNPIILYGDGTLNINSTIQALNITNLTNNKRINISSNATVILR